MAEATPSPEVGTAPRDAGRAAAFLDRDGTLIADRDYLADPSGVELLPGAVDGLHALRQAGYALVLVTNQSGIARGLYRMADYEAVHARLEQILAEHGIQLDGAYVCPHHPDYTGPCDCRKPAPGLYRRAAEALGLDLARSLFIGDKLSDVAAAESLGGTSVLVRTGYGREEETRAPAGVAVLDSLGALPGWLRDRR